MDNSIRVLVVSISKADKRFPIWKLLFFESGELTGDNISRIAILKIEILDFNAIYNVSPDRRLERILHLEGSEGFSDNKSIDSNRFHHKNSLSGR